MNHRSHFIKNTAALLLTSVLLAYPAAAKPLGGLGDVYYQTDETVSPGLTFSELHAVDGTVNQHAFAFTYTPGSGTLPLVTYGSSVAMKSTLGNMIREKTLKGTDVIGGMNADFFSFYTGIPMGAMVSDGRLLSSCDNRPALGLLPDGQAVIGLPAIRMELKIGKKSYKINHLNKLPSVYGVYLQTADYGESSDATEDSISIVIDLPEPGLRLTSTVETTVTEVRHGTENDSIPAGCGVIVVPNGHSLYDPFASLKAGDTVTLSVSCADGWEDAVTVIGGGDILLKNGVFDPAVADEAHEKSANPRTCVGLTADGRLIFFAVDGRNAGYSSGLTLEELASTMKAMGCETVLNLDGGGSTTVAVKRAGSDDVSVVNVPTDGSQRQVSNAVLFVNAMPRTGLPGFLRVTPPSPFLLTGGQVTLSCSLFDTSARPMELTSPVSYAVSPEAGTVSADGVFTASGKAGSWPLTATAECGGHTFTASTTVTVVDELTGLTVSAGCDQIPSHYATPLTVTGYYKTVPVAVSPQSLTWSFSEPSVSENAPGFLAGCTVGNISQSGLFTSADGVSNCPLTITASWGGVSGSVTVGIGMVSDIIQNFESKPQVFADRNGTVSYIGGGYRSDTALSFTGTSLDYLNPKNLSNSTAALKLWCYRDVGDSNLFAYVTDAEGIEHKLLWVIEEDYTKVNGWILLRCDIDASIPQPLTVNSILACDREQTFVLDDFFAFYGNTDSIFCDLAGHWSAPYVNAAVNMGIADGEVTEDGSRVYNPERQTSRAEFAKLLACFCRLDPAKWTDTALPYQDADTIPDWAVPYIKAVIGAGVMGGLPTDPTRFAANDPITRADVMVTLGGLLDPSDGISSLTFTDRDTIPDWALEKLTVTVSCGIVTGYEDNTVRPSDTINRAEIATVFSRMSQSRYYQP